jgi:hypothetical protein
MKVDKTFVFGICGHSALQRPLRPSLRMADALSAAFCHAQLFALFKNAKNISLQER